jgi:hypothetical protein
MSSCILTLLNGLNQSLALGIIGPGGSPFSDPITDPTLNLREGGFFGDLFAASPTAYVVGPQSDTVGSGRACGGGSSPNYCCPEDPSQDPTCTHHIIKAGSFLGSSSRCSGFATSGNYTYCTSFWTTREPNRSYDNVFTTFVPSGT